MKKHLSILLLSILPAGLSADSGDRAANLVILDATGVQNLRIQTQPVQRHTFETTVFAIGHLQEIPASRSVLSTRIAGRITELNVHVGDTVEAGQVLATVESRQPGNPPPSIELKAPAGGIVVESHVRLGQPVAPDLELLHIADRSSLWAVAHIPEPEVPAIAPGAQARIRIPAAAQHGTTTTLLRHSPDANHDAGTLDGIFVLPNPDGHLRPGMRAEFHITTARRDNVLCVPNDAVQGAPAKPVVFVKDFELPNAFVRAPVVLGQKNDRHTEILSGLFAEDDVVVRGAYGLSHAGGGSGLSLKEALDAAHGHEHNEDGSEMTPAQRAARAAEKAGHAHGTPKGRSWTLPIVAAAGFLLLALLQARWNQARNQA